MTPTIDTLDELVALMRAPQLFDDKCWRDAGLPFAHGERDWSSLPTFGGDEPADTREVWSWDATRLLVGTCADDLRIVERADYYDRAYFARGE